jgi:beta-fructofuranosidase
MVAVSSDENLLDWEKISGKTVVPNPLPIWLFTKGTETFNGKPLPEGALNVVYDPCIWKKGEYYYSISGGARRLPGVWKRHRQAFLFRSRDLKDWEYMHEFIEGDHFCYPGDDCGCPYFCPIGDKHILIHFTHRGSAHYMLGNYDTDRDKFHVIDSGDFGFGNNFSGGIFAPTAFPDGKGGVILMLTLGCGHSDNGVGTCQVFSLPRRLTISGEQLFMEPVETVETLRMESKSLNVFTVPANTETVLDECPGNVAEIDLEVDFASGKAEMFEVNILRSPDRQEVTSIRFHHFGGCRVNDSVPDGMDNFGKANVESIISIDSSYSSILPDTLSRMPENAPFFIPADENLNMKIFIDRSIVEVFVNGRQCAAIRVYPGREDSTGISFSARGGSATVKKCIFHKMGNIWDK